MSKKLHDIDFERTMIDKNKHARLFKVNIYDFNKISEDIYLHMTSSHITLYKKMKDSYGKIVRIYHFESFEIENVHTGKIQFNPYIITYYENDDVIIFAPDTELSGPCMAPEFEGNQEDCAFKRQFINVNDDGEPIEIKKSIPVKDITGLSLKIKEYAHTGFLK